MALGGLLLVGLIIVLCIAGWWLVALLPAGFIAVVIFGSVELRRQERGRAPGKPERNRLDLFDRGLVCVRDGRIRVARYDRTKVQHNAFRDPNGAVRRYTRLLDAAEDTFEASLANDVQPRGRLRPGLTMYVLGSLGILVGLTGAGVGVYMGASGASGWISGGGDASFGAVVIIFLALVLFGMGADVLIAGVGVLRGSPAAATEVGRVCLILAPVATIGLANGLLQPDLGPDDPGDRAGLLMAFACVVAVLVTLIVLCFRATKDERLRPVGEYRDGQDRVIGDLIQAAVTNAQLERSLIALGEGRRLDFTLRGSGLWMTADRVGYESYEDQSIPWRDVLSVGVTDGTVRILSTQRVLFAPVQEVANLLLFLTLSRAISKAGASS